MKELRKKIESKGYSLDEFLTEIGFGLRWYRTHSKSDAARYEFLVRKIDKLESKK